MKKYTENNSKEEILISKDKTDISLFPIFSDTIKSGHISTDYIVFGKGENIIVILLGLDYAFKSLNKTKTHLREIYGLFADNHKVYIFNRQDNLEEYYTTKMMAFDLKNTLDKLNITKANIIGISQGGMIAQYLAIDYPELVDKLIIGVSASRKNETLQRTIDKWLALAVANNYKGLYIDILEKSYREEKLLKYRTIYPIIARHNKGFNFAKFIILAKSCLEHNSYPLLHKIKCPTLVLAAEDDKIVGQGASKELASESGAKLIIWKGYGHGVYEELEDFNQQILLFINSSFS